MKYTPGAPGESPFKPGQKILNESWPMRDRRGRRHAEGIRDQPGQIDVDVRLVLETSGEVWLPGYAQRWTRTHVYVSGLSDPRIRERFVWVEAADVRRRPTVSVDP